jgi:hypothetical protein
MLTEQELIRAIFNNDMNFNKVAAWVQQFQLQNNLVYQQWFRQLHFKKASVAYENCFLPISFFKTHAITTTQFEPEIIFESSGTTQTTNSKHFVKNLTIYQQSFLSAFHQFYGNPNDWCIIGLLPSYLERSNSSLIKMVDAFMKLSHHPSNGFYLYNFEALAAQLQTLQQNKQKTLVIGVTFALLDFAAAFPINIPDIVIMETGGMKGRKEEMTRTEIHHFLQKNLGIKSVHSEYGMTELLSQAYSKEGGVFYCPPWMKVVVRNEEDPLQISLSGKGVLNIIDLANLYSCSFIATDDVGIVYEDGSFEVLGRLDNSDLRGCSLLAI